MISAKLTIDSVVPGNCSYYLVTNQRKSNARGKLYRSKELCVCQAFINRIIFENDGVRLANAFDVSCIPIGQTIDTLPYMCWTETVKGIDLFSTFSEAKNALEYRKKHEN